MIVEADCILSFSIAFAFSMIGLLLFRQGEKQIADGEEPLTTGRSWRLGMFVCNLALAGVLSCVYGMGFLAVLKNIFLCTILWICAWTDWKAYRIPNKILLIGLLAWILLFALEIFQGPDVVLYTAIQEVIASGGLLLAGLLCRLAVPGSIGFGDLKLFVVMGLYLGSDHIWNSIFLTLVVSFLYSIFLLATKKATRKSVIPFAPFLLLGTILTLFLNGG